MFTRLFGKPKVETNTLHTLDKLNEVSLPSPIPLFSMVVYFLLSMLIFGLHDSIVVPQTLEMLEKKEGVLLKKAAGEVERAKEFSKAKNKRAAIQCLKRKRLYEQQVEQLGNFQLRIHDQMIMLEGAKATTETVDALRTGAATMKAMQKATLKMTVGAL
ncbi:hypothetical protein F2Q70_00001120 [Brassica cretica]|uniref:Uncharacterized protein n=1 Tax=Brassica cretica TaxID=69181 RepID=A0A8S9IY28_BRACR|nr:hypothetical protein F2Q70_00001120 [Brassica cretica]